MSSDASASRTASRQALPGTNAWENQHTSPVVSIVDDREEAVFETVAQLGERAPGHPRRSKDLYYGRMRAAALDDRAYHRFGHATAVELLPAPARRIVSPEAAHRGEPRMVARHEP